MAIFDLTYGWESSLFELREVRLRHGVQLEEKTENGEWEEREPGLFFDLGSETQDKRDENISNYEKMGEARYRPSLRVLNAKMQMPSDMNWDMRLGVPETRQYEFSQDNLAYIQLQIREHAGEATIAEIACSGMIGYSEPGEMSEERVWASFYLPSASFDELEEAFTRTNIKFMVSLNIKGWHWTGPIGDGCIYIDKGKERQSAELGEIWTEQILTDRVIDEYGDEVTEDPLLTGVATIVRNTAAQFQLLKAAQLPIWLTALAASAFALMAFF